MPTLSQNRPCSGTLLALLTLLVANVQSLQGQEDVPERARQIMAVFQAADQWPAYGPADLPSRPGKFQPVRSVFLRETNLGSDSPVSARAVWEVDQVAWEGRPVTMISWFSGGEVAPRSSVGYVDPDSGALLYREISSTRKMTMSLVGPDQLVDHEIDRDGTVDSKTVPLNEPLFDRWALGQMMAGIELKEGLRFKMKALYPGTKEPMEYLVAVGAKTTIHDTNGNPHDVWPVLHPMGGPDMATYFVDSRPPYMFGFEARNLLTNDVSMPVTLSHFQLLN